MLDLVEIPYSRYGIQSLRYHSKMDHEARETVLAMFRKSRGPKVILTRYGDQPHALCLTSTEFVLSMRCGSVWLDLVSANRTVKCVASCISLISTLNSAILYPSMNLSWNYSTTSQSHDRVH